LKHSSQSSIIATFASVIAHLAVVLVILALPSAARQPSYYVLAYLVDNSGSAGIGARGFGDVPSPKLVRSRAGETPALLRKRAHPPEVGPTSRRSSAKAAERLAASAAPPADLSPGPSPKDTGTEAGATAERRSVTAGTTIADRSPFPLFGKGDRGLGSAPGAAGGSAAEAHALYDRSPLPGYPEIARRENQQGTVLLRVLVEADGSVARVEVAQSSGFDALDHAAADTVRFRWRFVPGERGGANIASWVLVPIRFALRDT